MAEEKSKKARVIQINHKELEAGMAIIEDLRRTDAFRVISGKTFIKDTLAAAAVHEISRFGDIARFYDAYVEYIRKAGKAADSRNGPEKLAKANIRDALAQYGDHDTDKVWLSVIRGKMDRSDFDRELFTRGMLLDYLRKSPDTSSEPPSVA